MTWTILTYNTHIFYKTDFITYNLVKINNMLKFNQERPNTKTLFYLRCLVTFCLLNKRNTYHCPNCNKKYSASWQILRSMPFILLIVIIPSMLLDCIIDNINFIQHKFLASTILLLIYVFILVISGAYI